MKKRKKISKAQRIRVVRAKRNYEKIQDRIKPFIKKRKVDTITTAGKWRESTSHNIIVG